MTKRLFALVLLAIASSLSCVDALVGPDAAVNTIEIVSGNNQSGRIGGALENPLVVKVTAKDGSAISGATITFRPDTGAGTVSTATALSDAGGLAQVNWTPGTTFGAKTLVASAGDGKSATFNATVVPDRLELTSGNNQIGRASAELGAPVVVKVVDLAGRAAAGVTVTFTPESGSGTVVPSVVATETDGTARAVWTLGTAPGPKVLRVAASTATAGISVNATATQDVLSIVSGGGQAIVAGATLPTPVVVQMKDQTGTIVAGAQLTFVPAAGSGSVSPTSVFTDAEGRAQTTWTLGATPGTNTLQVVGGSATPISVSAVALSTDSLQVVSGNAQAGRAGALLSSPVVVRVLDTQGRSVQGAVVRFAALAGSGSPSATSDTTDALGLAETRWTLGNTLGEMRLTATVGAAPPVTVTATTTQDRIELVSGGLQFGRVGTTLAAPIVVKLTDLGTKPVAGVVLTFAPDSANGTVLPTSVATDAAGEARTFWTVGAAAGPMTLRVSTITAPALIVNATAIEGQLSLVSGGGQAALAGTALTQPIVVKVQDQTGNPLAGSLVTFSATAANGTVSPTSIFSDASGLARTTWTLGATPGAKTLTMTGGTTTLSVSATALTGDSLEIVSGNAQAAQALQPLAAPIAVRVRDKASGRVVSGATVTFTPTTGSGTLAATTVVSDGLGIAQTSWTLGAGIGEKFVEAKVGAATVTFRATATQDRLELVSGGAQTARPGTALASPVVVRLFDINNRPMAGVEVSFTPDASSGTTLPSRIVTGSDGTARTVWTIGATPGVMRLTVSAGTAAPITVFATGGRDEIQLIGGGGQVGRVTRLLPDSITVRVTDPAGLPAGGILVTFTAPTGSGTPSPATATTNAQGIARTGWVLGGVPGPMTLTAASPNANPAVASALGTQDLLELVSGGDQVRATGAALAEPIAVRLRNQAGDSLVNEFVRFSPGAGTVSPDSVLTDLQGIARTTWTLGATAGAQTLTVTGGVANGLSVSATARTPDSLAIVSGNAQAAQAGQTLSEPIVVRVNEKATGRVVPGATVTFTVTAANGSVSATSAVTNANGLAQTTWTLGTGTGAKSLTVSVGAPVVSRTVTATATAERLEVVSGGNQTGRSGSTLSQPIVMRVVDLAGVAVPNVMVRFTPASGSGTVLPDSVATDQNGVARTAWTLGATAGTQSLVVNAGTAGSTTVFASAAQSRIVLESGGGQTARIQSALADSIVVKALSPESAVLPNVAITFVTTSGTVSPVTVTTNAQGLAKVRWTLGNAPGAVSLTAQATDFISAIIGATAAADTGRIVTLQAGNGQTGTIGAFLATPLQVKVTDSLNNPIAGETIIWNDSLTNGVTPVFGSSITNALGIAETSVRLGAGAGTGQLRARLGTRSETVTATMTTQVALAGIRAGNLFTCALTSEGRSYCWGFNGNGQLAKGSDPSADTDRPTTPATDSDTLVGPFQTFRDLSLGRTHACGVAAARQLYCWGTGNGALGVTTLAAVTSINGVSTTVAVASGEAHTCVLDIDGRLRCGGENQLGQLGDNSTAAKFGGTTGTVGTSRFSAVSAGRSFTCAFRQINTGDITTRRPSCWGDNGVGQLGRNSAIALDSVPATVSSAVTFDSTSLVTGLTHACALEAVTGVAYCWGGNGFGQVGDNSTTNRSAPTAVVTALRFVQLAAGEYHTCGVTSAGTAHCWGRNSSGQLGDGSTTNRSVPVTVTLPAGVTSFRSLALGELHSCAIEGTPTAGGNNTTTATGRVWCWGDNEYGQLGDGAASGNNTPVLTPKRVVFQP